MRLKNVEIKNFRSMQQVIVEFDPSCRILVGINESGKSNILRALSLIGSTPPVPEDVREPLPDEKSIDDAHVWFVFVLNDDQLDAIYNDSRKRVLARSTEVVFAELNDKKLTVEGFCRSRDEGLYCINLLSQKKYGSWWAVGGGYKIRKEWKKPSPSCPDGFAVKTDDGDKPLKSFSLVNAPDFPEIPDEYLSPVDVKDAGQLTGSAIIEAVVGNLPKVVVWQYEEKNLLPASISMDAFIANPDSCVPLKNMFGLASIQDIKGELSRARTQSATKVRNLLQRVANHATDHFREVWKEQKDIRFALEPNAENIEANIVEKNHWKMSQRSDGVKRFITFLLHISANAKTEMLRDALLLIDEPEMGLHPSGSRYLRDELIDISKSNSVIFSTHSIFMIDKENISRHIIVKKENEKTAILNADKSNFVDEEVLFNALNYSVFEILKKDNILFEGWRDKKLFTVASGKIPSNHAADLKAFKKTLSEIGLCHAEGVKDIRSITPLLELANRNCLIVSDSDKAAKEKQREYLAIHGYGRWLRYDEVSEVLAITAEDFLTSAAFDAAVEKLKSKYEELTDAPVAATNGRMNNFKAWLVKQHIEGDRQKEMQFQLKEIIFNNLKASEIDPTYYDFMKGLAAIMTA